MIQWKHSVATKTQFDMEHRFRRADGMYRWFTVKIEPKFEDGNIVCWYGNMFEIHEQKMFSKELAHARDLAEQANETKSAFLANMSHEIRTPLGAILGFTELLKDRHLEWKGRDQFLETISRNGKALTRIIDDILDLAKVESGKLDTEKIEFSFFDLLDEVLDLFKEKTKLKGIYLKLNMDETIPHRICSDPTRLRQIFITIIGNAVKFTENGGITVQVDATFKDHDTVQFKIAVQDTGVGVSMEQSKRLFQPFSQADNTTTRKFGGTGLGLVLSERLAKALGGQVTITDPDSGHGSVFTVSFLATLPRKNPNSLPVPKPLENLTTNNKLNLQGVKVLIADDSADNRFLVQRVLTNNGASVETANNGLEALNKALHGDFNIVLMDIQMPEMDGYEATRCLREAGYKKPIIALTAHAMAEEKTRTRAAGCDGHLTKPLNQKDLIETIQRHIKSSVISN